MAPTLLPEIVGSNLDAMQRFLDTIATRQFTREQADDLVFLCSFLTEAIEKRWAAIQAAVRKGIEGRKLVAQLQEVSGQIDETLRTRERCRGLSEERGTEDILSRLTASTERLQQMRQEAARLLPWLNAPPPSTDLERLKAREAGPFVRWVRWTPFFGQKKSVSSLHFAGLPDRHLLVDLASATRLRYRRFAE